MKILKIATLITLAFNSQSNAQEGNHPYSLQELHPWKIAGLAVLLGYNRERITLREVDRFSGMDEFETRRARKKAQDFLEQVISQANFPSYGFPIKDLPIAWKYYDFDEDKVVIYSMGTIHYKGNYGGFKVLNGAAVASSFGSLPDVSSYGGASCNFANSDHIEEMKDAYVRGMIKYHYIHTDICVELGSINIDDAESFKGIADSGRAFVSYDCGAPYSLASKGLKLICTVNNIRIHVGTGDNAQTLFEYSQNG